MRAVSPFHPPGLPEHAVFARAVSLAPDQYRKSSNRDKAASRNRKHERACKRAENQRKAREKKAAQQQNSHRRVQRAAQGRQIARAQANAGWGGPSSAYSREPSVAPEDSDAGLSDDQAGDAWSKVEQFMENLRNWYDPLPDSDEEKRMVYEHVFAPMEGMSEEEQHHWIESLMASYLPSAENLMPSYDDESDDSDDKDSDDKDTADEDLPNGAGWGNGCPKWADWRQPNRWQAQPGQGAKRRQTVIKAAELPKAAEGATQRYYASHRNAAVELAAGGQAGAPPSISKPAPPVVVPKGQLSGYRPQVGGAKLLPALLVLENEKQRTDQEIVEMETCKRVTAEANKRRTPVGHSQHVSLKRNAGNVAEAEEFHPPVPRAPGRGALVRAPCSKSAQPAARRTGPKQHRKPVQAPGQPSPMGHHGRSPFPAEDLPERHGPCQRTPLGPSEAQQGSVGAVAWHGTDGQPADQNPMGRLPASPPYQSHVPSTKKLPEGAEEVAQAVSATPARVRTARRLQLVTPDTVPKPAIKAPTRQTRSRRHFPSAMGSAPENPTPAISTTRIEQLRSEQLKDATASAGSDLEPATTESGDANAGGDSEGGSSPESSDVDAQPRAQATGKEIMRDLMNRYRKDIPRRSVYSTGEHHRVYTIKDVQKAVKVHPHLLPALNTSDLSIFIGRLLYMRGWRVHSCWCPCNVAAGTCIMYG